MNVETTEHFDGHQKDVPVGGIYDSYDDGEKRVSTGDIVVWVDPDAGCHADGCEFVHLSEYVGTVEKVYAVDYSHKDGHSVEIGASFPVGRIDAFGPYTAVVGENYRGEFAHHGKPDNQVDSFLSDDAEKYIHWEWHSGEDGVPEGLWAEYEDSTRTGPGCPWCNGEKDNPRIQTE